MNYLTRSFLFTLVLVTYATTNAQIGTWTQKADFPGGARAYAASFTIGGTAYVFGGAARINPQTVLYYNDLWAYDPATDTWSERAPLPGAGRGESTAFVHNGLGYVLGGANSTAEFGDLWSYDPVGNAWTSRSPIPTGAVFGATTFILNDLVYVVGGANAGAFQATFTYDPATDLWQEHSFEVGGVGGVGFARDGIGYFAFSGDGNFGSRRLDFLNAATNEWTIETIECPGDERFYPAAFQVGTKLYFAFGQYGGVAVDDAWFFDTQTQEWGECPAPGVVSSLRGGSGFSVAGKGYVVMGCLFFDLSLPNYAVWEFTPSIGTSIDETVRTDFRIYPSPTQGLTNLERGYAEHAELVVLRDAVGNELLRQLWPMGSLRMDLDLTDLASGLYLVETQHATGIAVQRLVRAE